MTTWYSDHFGTDGDNDTSLADPPKIVSAGISHGRVRYKRGYFKGLALQVAPDVIRFFQLRSKDRLLELLISSDGGSDAGALDIGLHLAGTNHDGAVVDQDLFASAQDISSAIERTDIFNESAVLQHEDHGKTLWELAAVGAASYTEDPQLVFEVTGTITTSFTTADSILVLEAYYTAGD